MNVDDFVCNILAGEITVRKLYEAVDRAYAKRKDNITFTYRFVYPYPEHNSNIAISSEKLRQFDCFAPQLTDQMLYECLIENKDDTSKTLETVITILLKYRNQFLELFGRARMARGQRQFGKRTCFVFKNFLRNYVKLDTNSRTYNEICFTRLTCGIKKFKDIFNIAGMC